MSISIHRALHDLASTLKELSVTPEREAEWLLAQVTGQSHSTLRFNDENHLTRAQAEQLNTLLKRRLSGEPLAHVLGDQYFWTLRLKVNSSVLIPRPDTELVVERALHHLAHSSCGRVLELGTGSGAIALSIATERPYLEILATDHSSAALAVAQENAALNQIKTVNFLQSDWFSHIPTEGFMAIISNPPYIAEDDPAIEASVRHYEPHLALFSEDQGLAALKHIIANAPNYLAQNGWLILEHGWQQASIVRELLESNGFSSVASHADLAGHLRVTEGQLVFSPE
jgi:release factor glutamine methyltransferase